MHISIEVNSVWQHENGYIYKVIAIANEASRNVNYPIIIVYKGPNGNIWAKELNNFLIKMTAVCKTKFVGESDDKRC